MVLRPREVRNYPCGHPVANVKFSLSCSVFSQQQAFGTVRSTVLCKNVLDRNASQLDARQIHTPAPRHTLCSTRTVANHPTRPLLPRAAALIHQLSLSKEQIHQNAHRLGKTKRRRILRTDRSLRTFLPGGAFKIYTCLPLQAWYVLAPY